MELQHVHRLAFCISDVETEVKVVLNDKKKKRQKVHITKTEVF